MKDSLHGGQFDTTMNWFTLIIAILPGESTSTSGTSAHSLSLFSSSARSCDGFPGNIGSEILGKVTTECDIQCRGLKSEIKHIFALIFSKLIKRASTYFIHQFAFIFFHF